MGGGGEASSGVFSRVYLIKEVTDPKSNQIIGRGILPRGVQSSEKVSRAVPGTMVEKREVVSEKVKTRGRRREERKYGVLHGSGVHKKGRGGWACQMFLRYFASKGGNLKGSNSQPVRGVKHKSRQRGGAATKSNFWPSG